MPTKYPLVIALAFSFALSGCGGGGKPFSNEGTALNPVTGRADEEAIAAREKQKIDPVVDEFQRLVQIHGGFFTADPALVDYVNAVGNTVAQTDPMTDAPFQFVITNNSMPQVFCKPGGKVAISRGLLAELSSEAELAAVLSHEVALSVMPAALVTDNLAPVHDLASYDSTMPIGNPTFQYATGKTDELDQVSFDETFVIEADRTSVPALAAAGYDATAAISFNERMLAEKQANTPSWIHGILQNSPCSDSRTEAISEAVAQVASGGFVGSDKYSSLTASLRSQAPAYHKLTLANKALWEGKADKAIILAKEGRSQAPNEGRFFSIMGRAYLNQGRYNEAVVSFNQAIFSDPSYYDNYLQRGITFLEMGNYSDARKNLEKSLGLLPTAEAHYHLGEIALETGEFDLARRHFFKASATSAPISSLAAEQLAMLDLRSNPSKFVSLRASLDGRGFLTIAAVNNSPIPINEVIVSLRVLNTPDIRNANKVIRFSEEIPAGKAKASLTDIGPFDGKEHLKSCLEAAVVGANPMISME